MGQSILKISDSLPEVSRLYIETSPLIYLIEQHSTYIGRVRSIVRQAEAERIPIFSSVITLTEVLSQPIRLGKKEIEKAYRNILLNSATFHLVVVTATIAESAARLRAKYNLRTPDALHVATAMETACDAFLTNDVALKRVQEVRVVVLDEF